MAGPNVNMNAVQLAGRWKPPQGEALPVYHDTETHVLLQAALLESAHMATQANKLLIERLAAYYRHVDEGWDPNGVIPKTWWPVPTNLRSSHWSQR